MVPGRNHSKTRKPVIYIEPNPDFIRSNSK
jgi:hypothetical protein